MGWRLPILAPTIGSYMIGYAWRPVQVTKSSHIERIFLIVLGNLFCHSYEGSLEKLWRGEQFL